MRRNNAILISSIHVELTDCHVCRIRYPRHTRCDCAVGSNWKYDIFNDLRNESMLGFDSDPCANLLSAKSLVVKNKFKIPIFSTLFKLILLLLFLLLFLTDIITNGWRLSHHNKPWKLMVLCPSKTGVGAAYWRRLFERGLTSGVDHLVAKQRMPCSVNRPQS